MRKKLLNGFTTAVVWFAVISSVNAGSMLLAAFIQDLVMTL